MLRAYFFAFFFLLCSAVCLASLQIFIAPVFISFTSLLLSLLLSMCATLSIVDYLSWSSALCLNVKILLLCSNLYSKLQTTQTCMHVNSITRGFSIDQCTLPYSSHSLLPPPPPPDNEGLPAQDAGAAAWPRGMHQLHPVPVAHPRGGGLLHLKGLLTGLHGEPDAGPAGLPRCGLHHRAALPHQHRDVPGHESQVVDGSVLLHVRKNRRKKEQTAHKLNEGFMKRGNR